MTQPAATFEQSEFAAKPRGFDEVIGRGWSPALVLQPACALVLMNGVQLAAVG
jgi:hypothetical protein